MGNYPANYEASRIEACVAETKDLLEHLSVLIEKLDRNAMQLTCYLQKGSDDLGALHLEKAHGEIRNALAAVKEAEAVIGEQAVNTERGAEMVVYGLPPQSPPPCPFQ